MTFSLDLLTGALSFLFTLLIFSYIFGDNPLFKIGVYTFVGVSSGYIASVAFWQALYPRLILPLLRGQVLFVAPLLLAVLILMKLLPRLAGLSSIAMSFLVGVGAAVTIVGAVSGTLIPQAGGSINAFAVSADPALFLETMVSGAFMLAGVIFSLAYFHFGAKPSKKDGAMRRSAFIEWMAWAGRIFIGVTLGAVFAGLFAAALTALIERFDALIAFVVSLLNLFGIVV
ncbi:MAG: hypothetical protein Fur002_14890 [Anaerolineales bacterium]